MASLGGHSCGQEQPKSGQERPKSPPKSSQERPKSGQEPPRAAKSDPRVTQERPRSAQEAPKSSQERLKSGQEPPKRDSRAAKMAQERLQDVVLSKKTNFSEECVFLEREHESGGLGAYVGGLGPLLGPMLAVLGADQGLCWRSWAVFGRSWSICWRSWVVPGPKWSVWGRRSRSWEGIRAEKWRGPFLDVFGRRNLLSIFFCRYISLCTHQKNASGTGSPKKRVCSTAGNLEFVSLLLSYQLEK